MRIALVTIIEPRPDSGDGITEYAYRLMQELRKRKDNEIEVVSVLKGVRRSTAVGLLKAQLLSKKIGKELSEEDYDVIHIMHNEMGSIAKYLKDRGMRAKIVTTIHDIVGTMPIYNKNIKRKLYNRVQDRNNRDAIKYSDYIIFNSTQTREEAVKRYGMIRNSAITSSGLKDSVLKSPIRRESHGKEFTVGYLGGFATHKNVIAILKTAKPMIREHSIRFVVYGAGTESKNVESYRTKNMLTNVELRGFVQERDIPKTLTSFDVLLFPSTHEGFGLPIIEAQAMGVPVIVFSKSRIPKEVSKYCIKALDEQHAAFQIRRLASGNKLVNIKKAAAYARSFTWKKNADKLQKIYRDLASEGF